MAIRTALAGAVFVCVLPAFAQNTSAAAPEALTIYNQDFAVVRTTVDLNLTAGSNQATTTEVTSQLEPDSVVLRDPAGKAQFKIAEQNYDAGVIDQNSMLQKFEGKTIQFQRYVGPDGKPAITEGKIIRAGMQPLVEVEGVMQFQLPGMPMFPASTDGLLLKPTLRWVIDAPRAAHFPGELAYITHGMSWQATYNVVAPDAQGVTGAEPVDLLGWITMQNATGTDFPQARIKLMAGDVAKLQDMTKRPQIYAAMGMAQNVALAAPAVTQQAFDDFHLYDLNRTVSLTNGETKQVQFLDANGVTMERVYQYDGAAIQGVSPLCPSCHNDYIGYGLGPNTKVNVRAEIKNSKANHLGMPLPAGRIRLYRRDAGGQMEFIGEGTIQHTPTEQTVKVPVGNAFDVTGERKQTDFHVNQSGHVIDETFEITVKNQKSAPVKVAVVEHLYRAQNWEITQKSADFTKLDSATLEFPLTVPPTGETRLTYTVHYTW